MNPKPLNITSSEMLEMLFFQLDNYCINHHQYLCHFPCSVSTKSDTLMYSSLTVSNKKHACKPVQERTTEEDIRKNGIASAELKAMYFLTGTQKSQVCVRYRK